jgi:hypothetical protein
MALTFFLEAAINQFSLLVGMNQLVKINNTFLLYQGKIAIAIVPHAMHELYYIQRQWFS